jgi:hypothetical protein
MIIINTNRVFAKIKHINDGGYTSVNINGYLVNKNSDTITIYKNSTTETYSKDEIEIMYNDK